MITEKEYKQIAHDVYNVDVKKTKNSLQKYDIVVEGSFIVLKTEDNPYNGMQAMAVAPIAGYDGDQPLPDYSQVVIAYAGTNSGDIKDLATDANQIGMGLESTSLPYLNGLAWIKEEETQFETAVDFALEVQKEVLAKDPNATITTTGHSLGESEAIYVALKLQLENVGFNGPDIHNLISDEEIEYMQTHKEQFLNYRNSFDIIGNITGNKTGVAIYPDMDERNVTQSKEQFSKKGLLPATTDVALDYHSLNSWKFNDAGQVVDENGQVVTKNKSSVVTFHKKTLTTIARVQSEMSSTATLANSLSSNGLTGSERIYLDAVQAKAVASGISSVVEAGNEQVIAESDAAIDEAKNLYTTCQTGPWWAYLLSNEEVEQAYHEGGATYEVMMTAVNDLFEKKKQQSSTLTDTFISLQANITTSFEQLEEADGELASLVNVYGTI